MIGVNRSYGHSLQVADVVVVVVGVGVVVVVDVVVIVVVVLVDAVVVVVGHGPGAKQMTNAISVAESPAEWKYKLKSV